MSVTIRSAVIEDAQRLAILNGFVQDLHIAKRPGHFKPTSLSGIVEWFQGVVLDPLARIWIADESGVAVGYVLTFVRERPENPFCPSMRWMEIDQLVVAPGFRRKGFATALIENAVMAAAAEGIADVEMSTWAFNEEAHSVTRRLGFTPKTLRWELKSGPR